METFKRNNKRQLLMKVFLVTTFLFLNLCMTYSQCIRDSLYLEKDLENAAFIFKGEVLETKNDCLIDIYNRNITVAFLKVVRCYKGNFVGPLITVPNHKGLDFNFKKGKTYIVFADLVMGDIFLRVNQCSFTKSIEDFTEAEIQTIEDYLKAQ